MTLENINPNIYETTGARQITADEENEDVIDYIDAREIFDHVRSISDPEHPLTLEQLHVLQMADIRVDSAANDVHIWYTPTIPHCSMATIIGLSIQVQLLRVLPPRYKATVQIAPGTHASERSINKQLADKERVLAAQENTALLHMINKCIANKP